MFGNLDRAMRALLIVGGLNWLAVASGRFDIVARLTGKKFGETNIATRVLYGLVGGAALYTLSRWIQGEAFGGEKEDAAGKRVHEVMTRDPRTIAPGASVAEAAKLLRAEDVGLLPVVDGTKLVGVVTDRDIALRVIAESADPQATTVAEISSHDPASARPEQSLEEALVLMAREQVRRLPVVEGGHLVGILAQADIADHAPPARTGRLVEDISR
jgi:CBS domain-containing protein